MTGGPPEIGAAAFAAVGLLLIALGAVQWWLRRHATGRPGPIRVVATCGLGGKRSLALVEVEEARFLLGLTDEGIACLGRLEDGAGTAAEGARLRAVAGGGPA